MKNAIKITSVGDICPGDKAIMGLGVASKSKKEGTNFFFNKISQHTKGADIGICNLEGILTDSVRGKRSTELTFSGLPEFADSLIEAGFNVINVANNHSLEHGPELFKETVSHLKNAGIAVCGLRNRATDYWSDPVILRKKGQIIGILGYNWVGVDKFKGADDLIAQSRDSLVNYTWIRNRNPDERRKKRNGTWNSKLIRDIRKLRKEVDFLILSAHWGYEFVHMPPYNLILEARSFIDAGADLIIGHHPHVIQGMEEFREKHIFYSLGNFIFDMNRKKSRLSCLLNYYIENSISRRFQFVPVVINDEFQPEEAIGRDATFIRSLFSESCRAIVSPEGFEFLDDDIVYREYERYYRIGKIRKVFDHFAAVPQNPIVLKTIGSKTIAALDLIKKRLKGKRVRW